jgi:SAM-dependent methyltransferase
MAKKIVLPYSEKKRNGLPRDEYLSIERDFHDQLATKFDWDEPVHSNLSYDRGDYGMETEAYFDKLLGDVKGKKVLDIGSGYGNTALNLALRGAEVSSIDIAPKLIEGCQYRAKKNNLNIDFQVMDASNITYPENYFDIIVGFRTIHHLPDLNKFCTGAHKSLKVGGFLLLVEPQKHNPFVEFGRYFIKNDEHSRTPTEHPIVSKDIKLIREIFGNLEKKEFEFLKPASLVFSSLKLNTIAKFSAKTLGTFDRGLVHIPFLRPLYWQVVIKSIKQQA